MELEGRGAGFAAWSGTTGGTELLDGKDGKDGMCGPRTEVSMLSRNLVTLSSFASLALSTVAVPSLVMRSIWVTLV